MTALNTLTALRAAIIAGDVELTDSLPTFGGADIDETTNVWSWDADNVLVGTCAEDLRIETRAQWAEWRAAR